MSAPRTAFAALAVTGGLAAAVAVPAGADKPDGAATRAKDQVVGSAVNGYPSPAGPGEARLTVSARGRALDPKGFVRAEGTTGAPSGEFKVSGEVTCLRVEGNMASIKYRFDRASGSAAPFEGGGVEVFVRDNGQPRGGQPVDENAFNPPQPKGAFDATAAVCDDPASGSYSRVRSGDYKVRQGRDSR
jgi:hypothetical protein